MHVSLPEMNSIVVRSRDNVHAAGDGVKSRMTQEATHVVGRIISKYVQPKQTIGRMTEVPTKKVLVLGKKSDLPLPVQQGENVIVFDTEMARMAANFPKRYPPRTEHGSLVIREVLVQQIQAGVSAGVLENGGRDNLPRLSSQDCRESLTASPTAASEIRPPQRVLQINSQDRPSATSSSTCHTIMRVPLNVGFPWQISGSATMYWPSSTRWEKPCGALFSPFLI